MIEVSGNLWTFEDCAIAITTNGFVKTNGECVMGRGCALEAAKMWPELPSLLGNSIRRSGNHVFEFNVPSFKKERCQQTIFSFPVKHAWWQNADIELIMRSAKELNAIAGGRTTLVPRPGCGNGHLEWEMVRAKIAAILDDNFKVITF